VDVVAWLDRGRCGSLDDEGMCKMESYEIKESFEVGG